MCQASNFHLIEKAPSLSPLPSSYWLQCKPMEDVTPRYVHLYIQYTVWFNLKVVFSSFTWHEWAAQSGTFIWLHQCLGHQQNIDFFQTGQVKDLCTTFVPSPVCQYGWPLWDSKDLRSATCPLLILPQMAAPIPCTKQDCPSPSPWQIDFVSQPWGLEEQSLWFCLLALSLWRTISLSILTSARLSSFSFH